MPYGNYLYYNVYTKEEKKNVSHIYIRYNMYYIHSFSNFLVQCTVSSTLPLVGAYVNICIRIKCAICI